MGIEYFDKNQVTYAWSGFNRKGVVSCTDSKCPKSCVTNQICQALGGNVADSTCVFCGRNSQWVGKSCVCDPFSELIGGVCDYCPYGFMFFNGNCIVCPKFSVYIAKAPTCVCLDGYFMMNGVCITCPANSGWNGPACACLSTYYLVGETCQQLPPNSSYNGTAFVCLPKHFLINGVCSQCPAKSSWDGFSCVCK
jgi:hypothetical protein